MLLAEDPTGKRISPRPGGRGGCPFCKSEVIAKCGEIKTWHWAHKSLITCDSWGEPEGDWHYGWKKLAGLDNTEITIEKDGKRHRADIIIEGLVIELQHSPLPVPEVREREEFYGNMMWVLDGETALLERSPDPVERWVSRNDTLYYKWTGEGRAWVNEISSSKWIHFPELDIYTYKWDKIVLDSPEMNRRGEMTDIRFRKVEDSRYNCLTLTDVMVNTQGKFCRILPKYDFAQQYLGFRQKSLFDF